VLVAHVLFHPGASPSADDVFTDARTPRLEPIERLVGPEAVDDISVMLDRLRAKIAGVDNVDGRGRRGRLRRA